MSTIRRISLAVCLATFFSLFGNPGTASACSCVEGGDLNYYLDTYDSVFSGKVVRIVDNYRPIFSTLDSVLEKFGFPPYFIYEGGQYWGYSVFIKVIESWKGVDRSIIEVDTGYGMGDCGYEFEIDQEYLIYASHAYGIPDNYWVTGICGRNAELADAVEDLEYLSETPTIALKPTLPIMLTEKDFIYASPFVLIGVIVFYRRSKRLQRKQ